LVFPGCLNLEALSLRAEREKEPNLDAVLPREDRDMEGLGLWLMLSKEWLKPCKKN